MLPQNTKQLLHATLLLCLNTNLAAMETTYTPNSLVTTPAVYLSILHTASDAFIKDFTTFQNTQKNNPPNFTALEKEYRSLVQKHEQTHPLFFLRECTEEDNPKNNDNCLLSRLYKPQFRASFENHTSQLLINKLQTSPTTPVNYTSFASGDAFQDLIIITKALMQQPKAQLNIHLIDNSNTRYVNAVTFFDYSREIKVEHNFSFGSRLAEYEKHIRNTQKTDLMIRLMSAEALQKQLTFLCLFKEVQSKQFVAWLKQHFSLAQICLYIHDQVNSYCSFLEKNNLPHADVVTAADIDDETSVIMGSHNDYGMLCIKTLSSNPDAVTAWLKKDNDNSVGICTACLPDANKPHEIEFDFKDI